LLQAANVISPADVPNGTPLAGVAPARLRAEEAKEKDYVAFVPTSIRLPSGRVAPIQPATVTAHGALDVPANPDRVGWWTGGARAGEPFGSIVLAGHVDSQVYGVGVLVELRDLRAGQELKLADGRHGQIYRVESVRAVAKAELSADSELFEQAPRHRLVMITCGGPFDRKAHSYRDNVVIVAKPRR
jgi:sortase family protein